MRRYDCCCWCNYYYFNPPAELSTKIRSESRKSIVNYWLRARMPIPTILSSFHVDITMEWNNEWLMMNEEQWRNMKWRIKRKSSIKFYTNREMNALVMTMTHDQCPELSHICLPILHVWWVCDSECQFWVSFEFIQNTQWEQIIFSLYSWSLLLLELLLKVEAAAKEIQWFVKCFMVTVNTTTKKVYEEQFLLILPHLMGKL